eukprot:1138728-Pelagomonas_calceolata.AAC.7
MLSLHQQPAYTQGTRGCVHAQAFHATCIRTAAHTLHACMHRLPMPYAQAQTVRATCTCTTADISCTCTNAGAPYI